MPDDTPVNWTIRQAHRIADGIRRAEAIPFQNGLGGRRSIDAIPNGVSFVVKLSSDGGSNGTGTTAPTYTYTVKDVYGATMKKSAACDDATGMTPLVTRIPGAVTAATYGLAFYDDTRVLQLLIVYEIPVTEACP